MIYEKKGKSFDELLNINIEFLKRRAFCNTSIRKLYPKDEIVFMIKDGILNDELERLKMPNTYKVFKTIEERIKNENYNS